MRATHPLIAISIGTVIALSPVGSASSQSIPASSLSSANLAKDSQPKGDPVEPAHHSEPTDPSESEPDASAQTAPDDETPTATPTAVSNESSDSTETDSPAVDPVVAEDGAIAPSNARIDNTDEPPVKDSTAASTEMPETPESTAVDPTVAEGGAIAPDDARVENGVDNTDPAQTAQVSPSPSESLPFPGDTSTPAPPETETTPDAETTPAPETDSAPPESAPPATSSEPVVSPVDLEYLDADPNPLLFPTRPEEVDIAGIQPITLQQALELAQRNSRDLQVAQLELERTRAELRETLAANLPTVQAGAGLTFDENQNAGRTDALGQPLGNQDDINTTLSGTLQLNYDLYTSGRRSATIRAAEGRVRFQELQVESIGEELRLNVSNDYYDLQEADEQVRISRAALDEAQRSLRDAEALERAGVGTRFDVLQAQVDVANSQQELTRNLSDQQISRRQLSRRLNLSETVNISAADPVQVVDRWTLPLPDSIVLAYRNRAELEQQLVQRDVAEQQRRVALADLGPQISLFADYNLSNLLNTDDGFNDTYRFGAEVRLNLFEGGAARARADQQEANLAIAETQFADTRNEVRLQVERAYLNLQASDENIQTAQLAVEQATEALRLARLRFQAGVGTQTDVLRSVTELTRSEFNLVNAILGYNRSVAQLQRAVSNLPDSNLSETP